MEQLPLALIASRHEWVVRSLESVIATAGYTVLRADGAAAALERARSARPDALIIDASLPDPGALEVCRALRGDPRITASTPILLTTPGAPSRSERLEALRAGANELIGQPLDAEEFLLRLGAHVRTKLDADSARQEGLVDAPTGLYNVRGLSRLGQALASQAQRRSAALACVVIEAQPGPDDAGPGDLSSPPLAERLAAVLRRTSRSSDAIGRLGEREFAIIAPDTDAGAAVRLGERLAAIMGTEGLKVRTGLDAVSDARAAPTTATDLLVRAAHALRTA